MAGFDPKQYSVLPQAAWMDFIALQPDKIRADRLSLITVQSAYWAGAAMYAEALDAIANLNVRAELKRESMDNLRAGIDQMPKALLNSPMMN